MVADQGQAVDIAILDDLERAVALPHASPGAEGLDDAADQGSQVEIRRRLLAQGVEGADLDEDLAMLGQGTEGLDVGVADRPVGAGADPAQVVDDDGRLGESAAHPVDLGEAVGIDQARERLAGLGGRGEHRRVTRRLEPARRRLLAVLRLDPEGAHAR